jgi:hypothetical protein
LNAVTVAAVLPQQHDAALVAGQQQQQLDGDVLAHQLHQPLQLQCKADAATPQWLQQQRQRQQQQQEQSRHHQQQQQQQQQQEEEEEEEDSEPPASPSERALANRRSAAEAYRRRQRQLQALKVRHAMLQVGSCCCVWCHSNMLQGS